MKRVGKFLGWLLSIIIMGLITKTGFYFYEKKQIKILEESYNNRFDERLKSLISEWFGKLPYKEEFPGGYIIIKDIHLDHKKNKMIANVSLYIDALGKVEKAEEIYEKSQIIVSDMKSNETRKIACSNFHLYKAFDVLKEIEYNYKLDNFIGSPSVSISYTRDNCSFIGLSR